MSCLWISVYTDDEGGADAEVDGSAAPIEEGDVHGFHGVAAPVDAQEGITTNRVEVPVDESKFHGDSSLIQFHVHLRAVGR